MQRAQVEISGVPVTYYELQGAGPMTFFFLHGVGGTGKMWASQMRHLHRYGRMIAVDLPGFEGGAMQESIQDLSDYAPLFARLLQHLQVEQAIWVGNSLGGRIALEAALQMPEQVVGLGLICAAGIRLPDVHVVAPSSIPPEEFDKLVFFRPELVVRAQSEASRQATLESRVRYDRLVEHTAKMDFQDRLAEIRVPTSVIWGRHDGVIPLSNGEAFAKHIPGARWVVLEHAAHVPHIEQPHAVNEELERLAEWVLVKQ